MIDFQVIVETSFIARKPGLEVIKFEFIIRLKIKAMIGCLGTRVRKQPIIALYFESELVLKFYNLQACPNYRLARILKF